MFYLNGWKSDNEEVNEILRTGEVPYRPPRKKYCQECGKDITDEIQYQDHNHQWLCLGCLQVLHFKDDGWY